MVATCRTPREVVTGQDADWISSQEFEIRSFFDICFGEKREYLLNRSIYTDLETDRSDICFVSDLRLDMNWRF